METRAHYALIGAFTLAVIAAGFMFVFWFSGGRTKAGVKSYQVVFSSSVSGLSRGSRVLFNGLNVGEVKTIDLAPSDPGKVFARIEVAGNTPVKEDTKARLEYQGLTGVATIALSGGSPGAKNLEGNATTPPQILAERSDFQNILKTVERLSGKVDSVITRVDKLIRENSNSIGKSIKNVEKFTAALSDNSDGVGQFMASISELGKTLKPMVSNIETLTKNLNTRITAIEPDKIKSILANADNLALKLSKSADAFDKFFAANADPLTETIKNAKSFSAVLADNSDEVKKIIANLSKVSASIKPVLASLEKVTASIDVRVKAIEPKQIAAIVDSASKLTKQLAGSVNKFDKFFDANSAPLTETVKNVQGFSKALADNKEGVQKLIASLSNLGKSLEPTVKNLETLTGDIGKRVAAVDTAKVKSIVDNAAAISSKLVGSADKLDKVLASVDKLLGSGDSKGALAEVTAAAKAIRILAKNLDARTRIMARGINRFTGAGLRQYEALAIDGRRTLRQLNQTIKSFKKNPQQVIFGPRSSVPEYSGR